MIKVLNEPIRTNNEVETRDYLLSSGLENSKAKIDNIRYLRFFKTCIRREGTECNNAWKPKS